MTATSKPKRILYLSPVGERGGAEVVLLNVLSHHDHSRFASMVCLLREGPLATEMREMGIKSFVVPTGKFREVTRTWRVIKAIRELLEREEVDLLFSNMAMGHLYGGLAALGTKVKRVWFQHTISSGLLDHLAALIPADRVYANSQAALDSLAKLGRLRGRVQIVYPGIDTSASPVATESGPLRRELGIPRDVPVVAMVARFQRGKGHHVFIEAASRVCTQLPEARFVVIGDTLLGLEPQYRAAIEEQVNRCGLSSSVAFVGWRNDVPALLSEIDILAHPSIAPESFGLAVVEALFHGKPVVASRHGGLVEVLTDGETGFLSTPGDASALAEKIVLLLNDPDLRRRIGEQGRQMVLQRFTAGRMIQELEQSYFEVLGLGGKASS